MQYCILVVRVRGSFCVKCSNPNRWKNVVLCSVGAADNCHRLVGRRVSCTHNAILHPTDMKQLEELGTLRGSMGKTIDVVWKLWWWVVRLG